MAVYTPSIETQIKHFTNEAKGHLENGDIYYARTALNIAIEIYEEEIYKEN